MSNCNTGSVNNNVLIALIIMVMHRNMIYSNYNTNKVKNIILTLKSKLPKRSQV